MSTHARFTSLIPTAGTRWASVLYLLPMLLLTGATAAAAPTYMGIEFGRSLVDFGEGNAWLVLFDTEDASSGVWIGDDNTTTKLDPFDVVLDWSGTLARRTSDPQQSTSRYEFTRGDVVMRFFWYESGWQTGYFRGHLDPFAFELTDNEVDGPQVSGLSGSGRIDANLAKFLGVNRRATITNMSFLLDEVFGQPGGDRWARGGCCQYVDLAFTPVPEPSLTLLLVPTVACVLRRRSRGQSETRR